MAGLKTYGAKALDLRGLASNVYIQAKDPFSAKKQLEALYGRISHVVEVR